MRIGHARPSSTLVRQSRGIPAGRRVGVKTGHTVPKPVCFPVRMRALVQSSQAHYTGRLPAGTLAAGLLRLPLLREPPAHSGLRTHPALLAKRIHGSSVDGGLQAGHDGGHKCGAARVPIVPCNGLGVAAVWRVSVRRQISCLAHAHRLRRGERTPSPRLERLLEPALTWVGRAGSTAAQGEPCDLPKRNREAWTTWVARMAHGAGRPSATHRPGRPRHAGPGRGSYLPHPASRIHVMNSPAISLYRWRGVW
jgi:hypothetical protein